ncbi:muscarinic acetylcholine receptor M2-like [Chiloscyllium plagiosum]|uniref:muscarinic acetylcholine receptor M2-like n=1 Tax=Chiloscyllium plagiosum TaxID=36176 RepID=UPI001CB7D641|nr:muscarinic acetylcholine receptor M2-like [Chiloscyllium plagiosum]
MANGTEATQSLSNLTDLSAPAGWCAYKTVEVVCIVIATGALSLVTIIGNILVIVSIKINRQLQTTNNYFIFSLACADLIIGAFSMNLYTIYTVNGYWPLGPVVCDLWLTVDYVVSNASVMNLLIISFDRYFCVTKPLIYPVKRTTKMAGMMVAAAWVLSFFLWAPAILLWQFIVGERVVEEGECYVQFFSNPPVTFGTAIIAFYIPVTIMAILYVYISRASKSRMKDDRNHSELCKATVTPSVVNSKLMKPNRTKTTNTLDDLLEVNMKPDTISNGTSGASWVQRKAEALSRESDLLNLASSNANKENATQTGTNCFTVFHNFRSGNLTCSSICSKFQKNDVCGIKKRTVSGLNIRNRNDREIRTTNNIVNVTRTHVKRAKGAVLREKKVTRTILAILLAFIITWTPYNVMVLMDTFCLICVPSIVWNIGYWLCYINSTLNPACYALCNMTFKKTFKHLLLCQCKNISATK